MEILKVKLLLCFLNLEEDDLNVTNMAITLGEQKYAVSRGLSALEEDGLVDRSNRRKPALTPKGRGEAEKYRHKMEGMTRHLLTAGVPQEDAKRDAMAMAVFLSDSTFSKLRQQGKSKRIKNSFHEGMTFDGSRLCRLYEDSSVPLTFLICKEETTDGDQLSVWHDRFENPAILQIEDGKGTVILHAMRGFEDSRFDFWDGYEWKTMEKSGALLSFGAEFMEFKSIAKDNGRMLYGRISLQIEHKGKTQRVLLTTYIA